MVILAAFIVLFSLGLSSAQQNSVDDLIDLLKPSEAPADTGRFFGDYGKLLFEQVSILNSMALAKKGDQLAALHRLKYMTMQNVLYDLPENGRLAGQIWKMIEKDRSFFLNTITASRKYQEEISKVIQEKAREFGQTGKTDEDRERVLADIDDAINALKPVRDEMENAWIQDNDNIRALSEAARGRAEGTRAKVLFRDMRQILKRVQIPNVGPLTDVVQIVLGGYGFVNAVMQKNVLGIVKSTVGMLGGVAALSTFAAVSRGLQIAGKIGVVLGLAFYALGLIIDVIIILTSNPAIDMANKISGFARQELDNFAPQLQHMSAQGNNFGWLYEGNTGLFIFKGFTPDEPIKFRQPSCASGSPPCDPLKKSFDNKPYLMLGTRRTANKGELEMPYDFAGIPTQAKFCGNTIHINTGTYRDLMDSLPSSERRKTGYYHRSFDIDTTTVPQYNDINFEEWRRSSNAENDEKMQQVTERSKIHKEIKRVRSQQDPSGTECDPASDRIAIEELEIMKDTGRAVVNTGEGDDLLSVTSWIGRFDNPREDILVADLGSGNNLLSLGGTLNTSRPRDKLVAGVVFDNTGGNGKVCYLKNDLRTRKCVGNVRGVKVFEGSRLHDTVVMGAEGPFSVIQNYGANEYAINSEDLFGKGFTEENPIRFEIMDTTGYRPQVVVKGQPSMNMEVLKEFGSWTFIIKMGQRDAGTAVAQVAITGTVSTADVVRKDGQQICFSG